MVNEFEVDDFVEFRTKDGAEFRGQLYDFTDVYFTIRTEDGFLGFPFEMIAMMWAA